MVKRSKLPKLLPADLTPILASDIPNIEGAPKRAWVSKKYLVQEYRDRGGVIRLSVNRVTRHNSKWEDKITWDELQRIKREVGYGDSFAVEIYPRDADVVNVSNMRHLWVMPIPLPFGWTNDHGEK